MMKKLSRTTIYLILISLFLLTVTVSLGIALMRQSDAALRTMIEKRMLDVANTAAAVLDGDALEAITSGDQSTPEYRSIYKTLYSFQSSIDLDYIYTVRDMGDKNFVFVIDPDVDPGQFGEPILFTEALYQASLGVPSVDKEPYGDRWGRFYSAYAPVYNSAHHIAGIVAVDFSAEWYEQQSANQRQTVLWISGIAIFFAVSILILASTGYRRRFRDMLGEMNAISGEIETLVQEISPGAQTELLTDSDDSFAVDEVTELGNRIRSLESQLSRQISHVRSQAFIDALTGLGNRSAYEEHVKQLDDAINEGGADFSVALFDLNGLKQLNDRFGHERGDQAIVALASVLRQVFDDAKLYRIGGDEFIAVLETAGVDILSRFPRVDSLLAEQDALSSAKGCAAYEPGADLGYRVVFNRADYAMYNDKRAYYLAHAEERKR